MIWLDIDYQIKNRPFTVDQERFPHFEQMVTDLKEENFHVVTIMDLHIANLPNADTSHMTAGVAGDKFVKNPDGSIYIGVVWPGPSVFPDFTRRVPASGGAAFTRLYAGRRRGLLERHERAGGLRVLRQDDAG